MADTNFFPFFPFTAKTALLIKKQRSNKLSLSKTSNFMWQFFLTRVDEENWPIFTWYIYLPKSWRVNFYVTKKKVSRTQNCSCRRLVAQNVVNMFMSAIFSGATWRGRLSSPALFLFISAVQRHYWLNKLEIVDKYVPCHLRDQIYFAHTNCHIKLNCSCIPGTLLNKPPIFCQTRDTRDIAEGP